MGLGLPTTSQRTYMHDMTPMNSTRYRRASPPATNQNKTIKPDMPRMSSHELQSKFEFPSSDTKTKESALTANSSSPTKA